MGLIFSYLKKQSSMQVSSGSCLSAGTEYAAVSICAELSLGKAATPLDWACTIHTLSHLILTATLRGEYYWVSGTLATFQRWMNGIGKIQAGSLKFAKFLLLCNNSSRDTTQGAYLLQNLLKWESKVLVNASHLHSLHLLSPPFINAGI